MTLHAAIRGSKLGSTQYVEGFAYRPDGTPAIPLTIAIRYKPTGQLIGDPGTIQTNNYAVWTDKSGNDILISFTSPGMAEITRSFSALMANPTIQFSAAGSTQKAGGGIITAAAALAVLLAVLNYQKRTGKVGKLSTADLFPIFLLVGGVIAFDIIRRILEAVGLWKDRDEKDLDNAATDPGSFWNPNYWRNVLPSGAAYTYAIDLPTATQWASEIYNAFGVFNDNEEQVFNVFRRCKTRANASYIAYAFGLKYGEDLLKFLRGGWWPQDRLSDADVNEITKFINKLPKY